MIIRLLHQISSSMRNSLIKGYCKSIQIFKNKFRIATGCAKIQAIKLN